MFRLALRCVDCLAVGFAEGDWRSLVKGSCDCGGGLEMMGRVKGQAVLAARSECPCNSVCTHAKGPNCDCKCGGENHGTGRLIEWEERVGSAPIARFGAGLRTAKQERQRAEWKEAEERASFAIELLRAAGRPDYWPGSKLEKAREARTHASRMKWARLAFEAATPPVKVSP